MCEYLCFPPLTKSPSLTLQEWNGLCQNQPLLGTLGRKKKKMHPLYDSLIGSFQSADSSSLLTGQEGDVEIYEWPMYCWMMALHVGSLRAECEGMHSAFVGMNAGFPFTRRSLRVCAWPHPTVFKKSLPTFGGKPENRRVTRWFRFSVSYRRRSLCKVLWDGTTDGERGSP